MNRAEKIKLAKNRIAAKNGHAPALGKKTLLPAAPTAPGLRRSIPCVSLGEPNGEMVLCGTCAGTVRNRVMACSLYGKVTRAKSDIHNCAGCGDYQPVLPPLVSHVRIDETNLFPSLPGKRFNPGLMAWEGGYLFCWRDGWKGSDLWMCRMTAQFQPVGRPWKLDIRHRDANYGREDAQLFLFRGRVHVAFVGVEGHGNKVAKTNVLYARLSDALEVEDVFAPKAPGVPLARWQKNHLWYVHNDSLYAVYSIVPHKVLRIDGGRAEWAYETPTNHRWKGGELHGGTTPVKVGDEFYSFFHDRVQTGHMKSYRLGLYTFDAEPPFAPRRMTPHPVKVADPTTNPGNYCHCIFSRGAVLDGGNWVVSVGEHDRFSGLYRFSRAYLESKLVAL